MAEGHGETGGEESGLSVSLRLRDMFTRPLKQVDKVANQFKESIAGLKESFEGIGQQMWLFKSGVEALGLSFLQEATEPMLKFQDSLIQLGVSADLTDDQLEGLGNQAHEISTKIPYAAESVLSAQKELIRSFGNVQKAQDATTASMRFAYAAQIDAGDAAHTIGQLYQSWGDKTIPLQAGLKKVSDQVLTLSKYGVEMKFLPMMTRQMVELKQQADLSATSMDYLKGVAATLSRSGIAGRGGRMAFSQTRMLLETLGRMHNGLPDLMKVGAPIVTRMIDGVRKFDLQGTLKQFKQMQQSSPQQFQNVMGNLGPLAPIIMQLLAHLNDIPKAEKDIKDSAGETARKVKEENKSWLNQITLMTNAWDNFKDALTKGLGPQIGQLSHDMAKVFNGMAKFLEDNKTFASTILYLAEALTAVIAVGVTLGGLGLGISYFGKIVELVLLPLKAFAGMLGMAALKEGEVAAKAMEASEGIGALPSQLEKATSGWKGLIDQIKSNPIGAAIGVGAMASGGWDLGTWLRDTFGPIKEVGDYIGNILYGVGHQFQKFLDGFHFGPIHKTDAYAFPASKEELARMKPGWNKPQLTTKSQKPDESTDKTAKGDKTVSPPDDTGTAINSINYNPVINIDTGGVGITKDHIDAFQKALKDHSEYIAQLVAKQASFNGSRTMSY